MIDLMNFLPEYYKKSSVFNNLINAQNNELQLISDKIENTVKEMFISNADDLIELYELDFGIESNPNESLDFRRARIQSKIKGIGTVTKSMIENIVKSYVDSEIEIIEDFENYNVTIKFITFKGQPKNIFDIQNELNELIPAHLIINYRFTYRTWNDIQAFYDCWDNCLITTWDGLSTTEIIKNLLIDENEKVYYCETNGNAILIYKNNKPFARLILED